MKATSSLLSFYRNCYRASPLQWSNLTKLSYKAYSRTSTFCQSSQIESVKRMHTFLPKTLSIMGQMKFFVHKYSLKLSTSVTLNDENN